MEGEVECRLDVVLFVNGLPLGCCRAQESRGSYATIWTTWQQHCNTSTAELGNQEASRVTNPTGRVASRVIGVLGWFGILRGRVRV
ncbi:MAG: hypothetical protein OXI96_01180 [Acidimicrobiaceae bacterium]|nr:hypothetical protein [Acidimicrobiaceae bacterium]